MASHSKHTAGPMGGSVARIVYGFGWTVPEHLMPHSLARPDIAVPPTMAQFSDQLEMNWR